MDKSLMETSNLGFTRSHEELSLHSIGWAYYTWPKTTPIVH